jgi:hypothetical protein
MLPSIHHASTEPSQRAVALGFASDYCAGQAGRTAQIPVGGTVLALLSARTIIGSRQGNPDCELLVAAADQSHCLPLWEISRRCQPITSNQATVYLMERPRAF